MRSERQRPVPDETRSQRARGAASCSPGRRLDSAYAVQRTIGNRAVARIVQTKLLVGDAGDAYEREADHVAALVMRSLTAGASKPMGRAVHGVAARRATNDDTLGGTSVGHDEESVIARTRGRGRAIPLPLRSRMETAFGTGFESVRVHDGPDADTVSRALQARAFTTGRDIYFSAGAYHPGQRAGQELLAHELTHVVQQGSAGNGAVAQRALGFEFETNMTTARLPPGKKSLSPTDQSTWSPANTPGAQPLKKGEKILVGKRFTAEADELPSGRSDLEFVTSLPPFPETKKGRDALIATMQTITGMATHIDQNKNGVTKRGFQATEFAAFGSPKIKDAIIGPSFQGPLTASPQSTAAIRLSELADMMEKVGTPTGVGGNQAPPQNPKHLKGQQDLMGLGSKDVDRDIVGKSAALARAAANGLGTWLTTKNLPSVTATDEMRGLLALTLTYLLRGDSENLSYAKNIAIFLGRTNFATMFKQISKDEQRTFRANKGALWSEFVLDAAGLHGTGATPLFVQGLNYDAKKKNLIADLTRDKWLKGMATGTDILTSKKIGGGRGKEMESLGRLGSKTEKVGTGTSKTSAPIFELRRMKASVPYTEWTAMALNVFDYVRQMNDQVATPYYHRKNKPGGIQPST